MNTSKIVRNIDAYSQLMAEYDQVSVNRDYVQLNADALVVMLDTLSDEQMQTAMDKLRVKLGMSVRVAA